MGYVTGCWDKDLAKFFLRMVATAEEGLRSDARSLWQEAKELHLIFCSISIVATSARRWTRAGITADGRATLNGFWIRVR